MIAMFAWSWETLQMLTAALAPLVAVPLGVITFYLRSLYENQVNRHTELVRRFELVERTAGDLAKTVSSFALDYTTKEEWLRECMYARGRIERLTELLASDPRILSASEPRTSVRADSPMLNQSHQS